MSAYRKSIIFVDVAAFALLIYSAVFAWPFTIYFIGEWLLWLGALLLIGFNIHLISQDKKADGFNS